MLIDVRRWSCDVREAIRNSKKDQAGATGMLEGWPKLRMASREPAKESMQVGGACVRFCWSSIGQWGFWGVLWSWGGVGMASGRYWILCWLGLTCSWHSHISTWFMLCLEHFHFMGEIIHILGICQHHKYSWMYLLFAARAYRELENVLFNILLCMWKNLATKMN